MLKLPKVIFSLCVGIAVMIGVVLPLMAQDNGPDHPVPVTPGIPLVTVTPTTAPNVCYTALPLRIPQIIYIKPDVNIRAAASGSSAIVWNTMFNNRDEDGEAVENPVAIEATVIAGPVCAGGQNWWQVEIAGANDGWVAEGRLDREGQYLIVVPGLDFDVSCHPIYSLQVGQSADLAFNVRVRVEPNTDARTVTIAPAGSRVELIQGPRCVNQYQWWLVRVTVLDVQYVGWMAEGADELYWLLPTNLPSLADGTLCNAPLPFSIDQQGIVNTVQNNNMHWLRASAGLNAPQLALLVENVPFVVVGGPVCRDNLNWWNVRLLSSSPVYGWIAEGSRGVGFWLEPLDPNEYAR